MDRRKGGSRQSKNNIHIDKNSHGRCIKFIWEERNINLPEPLSSSSSSVQSILSAFVQWASIVHCISMQIVTTVADNRINANIIFNSIFDGFVFPIIVVFIELNFAPDSFFPSFITIYVFVYRSI